MFANYEQLQMPIEQCIDNVINKNLICMPLIRRFKMQIGQENYFVYTQYVLHLVGA